MKIGFLSDPHLGLVRAANTTPASRYALQRTLVNQAVGAAAMLRDKGCKRIVLAGDLFDTFSNNEQTLIDAWRLVNMVDYVLAGNHDIKNDTSVVGSMHFFDILHKQFDTNKIVMNPTPQTPRHYVEIVGNAALVFVPHVLTQEIFEAALKDTIGAAPSRTPCKILCLHCNVGVPGEAYAAVTKEGTSLYLTNEMRLQLEAVYDFIVIGHEHPPKIVSDKTYLLGNTMPIAFGEIADRFVHIIDTETKTIERIGIFEKDSASYTLYASEVLAGAYINPEWQYIDIQGIIKHDEQPALSKHIAEIWKASDQLLMLRNATKIAEVAKPKAGETDAFRPRTLPEAVSEAVVETPWAEPYREAVAALDDHS